MIWSTPTACIRDASPAAEKFPLIIHIPGSVNQSVMIEFLVSHGYVVASLPLIGSSPATYGRGDASRSASLTQMEDIQLAIRELSKERYVDMTRIGMFGMFAQVGIELQMKDQLFSSIACLDCAADATAFSRSPYYDARKVSIPILQIQNSDQNQSPSFFDSLLYAQRYDVDFKNFPHADFYPFKRIARPARAKDDLNYERLSVMTLNFFNTTLTDKLPREHFLKRLEAFKPDASISIIRPLPLVAHEQQFLTWLREGDMVNARSAITRSGKNPIASKDPFFFTVMFLARDRAAHAWEAIKMFVSTHPGYPRALRLLNTYGYYFLKQGINLNEARFAFTTMMEDYPNSPYSHDAWADYLMEVGKTQEAVVASRSVLKLVMNAELTQTEKEALTNSAKQRLAKLEGLCESKRSPGGPHEVGFKTIQRRGSDHTQLISIWYPASLSKRPMSFKDYVASNVSGKKTTAAQAVEDFKLVGERIYATRITDSLIHTICARHTNSARNAKPSGGRFPLVIAYADATAYHELFEFIASHGIVVAGVSAKFEKANADADSPDHYTRYTNLLEDLKKLMVNQSNVDTTNISAFGHGGGIQAAMYLAMRSRSIKRVINLDGGFFSPRSKTTISHDYQPTKFSVPLLHIITTSQNTEDDKKQLSELKSPITKVTIKSKAVRHHDFTAWRKVGDVNRNADELNVIEQTLTEVNALILFFLQGVSIENCTTPVTDIDKIQSP
jgi:hypothetical protein